ncbi:S-methyl-5'-thioadenosine phosphorylase [uncultured archaeon]|nr:S-methyl-5'-thioadenosine phosphorylase [uncultured archaeon]
MQTNNSAEIGLIGGTGVYDPALLENAEQAKVWTPYGATSSPITIGMFKGRKIAFIARHGLNHTIPPHKVNWRANIYALKELGVSRILATCATGSLKEDYKPGTVVIPDQFVDFSKTVHTFYDEGKFYHVGMAEPFCSELRTILINEAKALKLPLKEKGTYLRIEGPQFSTRAASNMYRQFADLIGMTGVPEAILAREKELCFAIIATVTDYDVWKSSSSFEEIKNVMAANIQNTKKLLEAVIPKIPKERKCICKDALKGAEA